MPNGTAEAYVARPDDGVHPGVLLFIDAIGLRPATTRIADRIASWGYVVMSPNLFYRSGTAEETSPKADLRAPGERERFFAEVGPRMAFAADQAVVDDDLRSYLTALRELSGVAAGPVGVTGYCMGARLALRAACLDPGSQRSVAFTVDAS